MKISSDEYGEFYENYISYSNGIDLFNLFRSNADEILLLMNTLTEEEAHYRYDEGKWSVKEVFGHLTDTERILAYRALVIARGEEKPIHGFDQNQYAEAAGFDRYSLENIREQYEAVRNATIILFRNFSEGELLRKGTANDAVFSVRALGYTIAGHEMHHLRILSERYLPHLEEE